MSMASVWAFHPFSWTMDTPPPLNLQTLALEGLRCDLVFHTFMMLGRSKGLSFLAFSFLLICSILMFWACVFSWLVWEETKIEKKQEELNKKIFSLHSCIGRPSLFKKPDQFQLIRYKDWWIEGKSNWTPSLKWPCHLIIAMILDLTASDEKNVPLKSDPGKCGLGFRWDRQWLVVNSKGRAYTQRVEPKLALVVVELPIEAFSEDWEPNANSYLGMLKRYSNSGLLLGLWWLNFPCFMLTPCCCIVSVVKAPGMSRLNVSLSKPGQVADGVSVWEWCGSALDEGEEAAKWFSDYLGKPSRLVRFNTGRSSIYSANHNLSQTVITFFFLIIMNSH